MNILVIPRDSIPTQLLEQPFSSLSIEDIKKLCKDCEFKVRADMEEDNSYKQMLPYIAVISGGKVLSFKRSKTGGEGRLYDKYSLAVGGHVDQISGINSRFETVLEAVEREIKEEIDIDITHDQVTVVGTIGSDEGVDAYHLSLQMIIEIDDLDFSGGEEDKLLNRKMMNRSDIEEIYDKLESWSQKFYDHYLKDRLD